MNQSYFEADYERVVNDTFNTRFLPDTGVEVVHELTDRAPPRHVLFDFDGTLSLVREGWPEVMVPMMIDILRETGTDESIESLRELVYGFVMQLNGKQTIYQMIRLAEEVSKRGAKPKEPLEYKQMYHDRLMERIAERRKSLESGECSTAEMMVPFAIEMLEELCRRGVELYLASGTDEQYVIEETRLLGLDRFFGSNVFGAPDDYKTFSKAMVIDRILSENKLKGDSLLGFGDGYVEIQNVKSVGGTAVAVASDESGRSGKPDLWKRDRLIGVGADLVVPDYRDWKALTNYIWNDSNAV